MCVVNGNAVRVTDMHRKCVAIETNSFYRSAAIDNALPQLCQLSSKPGLESDRLAEWSYCQTWNHYPDPAVLHKPLGLAISAP